MSRITEDTYLDERIGQPVTMYLINGIKLKSMILVGHDAEVLFLRPENEHQGTMMVMKQAISTILSDPPYSARPDATDTLYGVLSRPKQM